MTEPLFSKIPNAVIEALFLRSRPAYQVRVILFLLRMTYGFHRLRFKASIAELARSVNMPRAATHLTIAQLLAEGVIDDVGGAWLVNHPEKWRSSP